MNNEGKVLVGAKSYFFSPTIARLLGVDDDEDIHAAAVQTYKTKDHHS